MQLPGPGRKAERLRRATCRKREIHSHETNGPLLVDVATERLESVEVHLVRAA